MAIKLENKVTESCGISSINAENSVCHKVSILHFFIRKIRNYFVNRVILLKHTSYDIKKLF